MLNRTLRRARSTLKGRPFEAFPDVPSLDLPPEILSDVFDHLRPPTNMPSYEEWYKVLDVDMSKHVIPRHLYNACLVCRGWYEAGTDILYSRIFLTSPRRIASFCRTIQRRTDLVHRVQELSLCDASETPGRLDIIMSQRLKQVAEIKANTLSIVATCSSLTSLTLYIRPQSGKNSLGSLFQSELRMVLRFRPLVKFTLIGQGFYNVPLTPFYDGGLKHLVLRRSILEVPELDPWRLRSLQSLVLIKVRSRIRDELTKEIFENLPQLRALVVVESISIPSNAHNLPVRRKPTTLSDLEKLTLVSTEHLHPNAMITLQHWLLHQMIPNVRDLTVGVVRGCTPLVPWFTFPTKLESLTFLILPLYDLYAPLPVTPQLNILRCLEHNKRHFERGTMKRLVLLLCVRESVEGMVVFPHKKIRAFCERYGVDVMQGQIRSITRWAEECEVPAQCFY